MCSSIWQAANSSLCPGCVCASASCLISLQRALNGVPAQILRAVWQQLEGSLVSSSDRDIATSCICQYSPASGGFISFSVWKWTLCGGIAVRISIQHGSLHEKRLWFPPWKKKKKNMGKSTACCFATVPLWGNWSPKMHLSHAERREEKDANEFSYLNFYLQFIPASSDSCSDSAEWDEAADWAGVVAMKCSHP